MKQARIIFLLWILYLNLPAVSQDRNIKGKSSIKSERKVRKELRHEAAEKRKKERAERKAIKKYHKRLQTKKVRKRMKTSKKSAIRYNENKREFFVKRWFKKKKRV